MEQAVGTARPADQEEQRRGLLYIGVAFAGLLLVQAPILRGMFGAWIGYDDHSHGLIVAPLALLFALQRREALRKVPLEGSWLGLIPLGLGLLALMIGSLGGEFMSLRISFPITVAGLVLLLAGRRAFAILAFPIAFAFLMVPLPQALINVVAFPLQLFAARMAVWSLHGIGIPVLLEGNIIHMARLDLFVAEACSGLRSLMALVTLGVVFAHVTRRGRLAVQLILIASTIPIAILVNAGRVALTGFLAHHYGQVVTEGAIHEFQGLFTFGIALVILVGEMHLIDWLARFLPSSTRSKTREA